MTMNALKRFKNTNYYVLSFCTTLVVLLLLGFYYHYLALQKNVELEAENTSLRLSVKLQEHLIDYSERQLDYRQLILELRKSILLSKLAPADEQLLKDLAKSEQILDLPEKQQ